MADKTAIEWTDSTVNFWWGCTKVGPGCDHCYAEAWSKRAGESIWGVGAPRRPIKSVFTTLNKLQRTAAAFHMEHGRPRRVFIQSMSDLFDNEVPIEWFATAWGAIHAVSDLRVQIVTKRLPMVEKRLEALGEHPLAGWPRNPGLLASVVNQDEAERDIPRLIALKVKYGIPWIGLSMEPLLGTVVLREEWLRDLDWVIVGGESGPGARPMHPDWARSLRDQCAAAGVAFHFKQWGEWFPGELDNPSDGSGWIAYPDTDHDPEADKWLGRWKYADGMLRVGKKRAGRLLDGRTYDGFPEALA